MTPAYQFCLLQRITGYSELPVTETWYRTELPKATFPYHTSDQPVIGAGLDWKDNRCHPYKKVVDSQTSFQYIRPEVSHLTNNNYCVNAAPCRRLAWDKKSVKCEKLCQPHRTGPDHNKNRETVNLDHCHQTGPVSGGTENVCQTTTICL